MQGSQHSITAGVKGFKDHPISALGEIRNSMLRDRNTALET